MNKVRPEFYGLLGFLAVVVLVWASEANAGPGYWTLTSGHAAAATCDAQQHTAAATYSQCIADEILVLWGPIGNSCGRYPVNSAAVDLGNGTFIATLWIKYDYYTPGCTDGTTDETVDNLSISNPPASCWDGSVPDVITGDCPVEPASCDDTVTGQTFWRPGNSLGGGDICHESSNCVMTAINKTSVGSSDLIQYTGTGNDCGAEPPVPQEEVSTDEQCINDGGNSWCTETGLADENCGMYNGEYLCLASVPEGGCTFFGNGDMACDVNAGSPPAPDNGTPGTPATPDGTIGSDNGTTTNTTNIFGSTTVNNSGGGTSGTSGTTEPGEPLTAEVDFSDIIESSVDPGTGAAIDTMAGDLGTELDGVITELGDPNDFIAPGITLDNTIVNSLTGSACTDIVIPFPGGAGGGGSAVIGCSDLATLRAVLGWILKVVLAMYFFDAIMTRPK